jgi:hypothetical protein
MIWLVAWSCVLVLSSCSLAAQSCGLEPVSLEAQDNSGSCLRGPWESLGHKSRSENPSHHNCENALMTTNVSRFLGAPKLLGAYSIVRMVFALKMHFNPSSAQI